MTMTTWGKKNWESACVCAVSRRLEAYRNLSPLRLIVCGGDGSVGWVLKEIDKLHLKVIHTYILFSFARDSVR